jgi:hypothetical protein
LSEVVGEGLQVLEHQSLIWPSVGRAVCHIAVTAVARRRMASVIRATGSTSGTRM